MVKLPVVNVLHFKYICRVSFHYPGFFTKQFINDSYFHRTDHSYKSLSFNRYFRNALFINCRQYVCLPNAVMFYLQTC